MTTHGPLAFVAAVTLLVGCSTGSLAGDAGGHAGLGDLGGPRDLGRASDGAAPDLATSGGCAGLDQDTCRATPGCVADTCTNCSCTPTFVACVAVGAPMVQCPALGCAQPVCCRKPADCTNLGFCLPPGAPQCGGACFIPPPCTRDSDCATNGPTWICAVPACPCNGNHPGCQPGCATTADCGEDEVCLATHHCAPTPCTRDTDCAPDFQCMGGGCQRRGCAVDDDCPSSWCVDGACYLGLGECRQPVP